MNIKSLFAITLLGAASADSARCKAIFPTVTDQWCIDNCGSPRPSYCPAGYCKCKGIGPAPKPTPKPSKPTPAPAPKPCKKYVVISGDTCNSIAGKFGTTLAHISLGNGQSCPWMIYPNQELTVCPASAPTECQYHEVGPGDTCAGIAAHFGTDLNHIFTADGSPCPWMIYPGQDVMVCPNESKLTLSATASPVAYPRGTSSEPMSSKTCTSVNPATPDQWCEENCHHDPSHCPADHCACGPVPQPPKCKKYVVISGDTCNSIAGKFGTTLAHISLGNGKSCPWMIYPGQELTVCPASAPTECQYHEVGPGDTCAGIAAHFGTDLNHVFTADGSPCPWMIYPGQDVMVCPNRSESKRALRGSVVKLNLM